MAGEARKESVRNMYSTRHTSRIESLGGVRIFDEGNATKEELHFVFVAYSI